ncbi:MAG: isoprenylcysteine carboxylmethyltransferase family protein [FCB group bacterium]|nr:isoprenylcysteine carboxylmethyltransferase family protein [FCB group bacterium]
MDAKNIYLGLILIFFILAFFARNIKTYLSTNKSIKGKSVRLTISVLLSTSIYSLIFLRLTVLDPKWILELDISAFKAVKAAGFLFVTIGFILGLLALSAMKSSWRVGIKYDQKTDLITDGIYRFSRNPYFLSYDILIFGYCLIFPSILLIVLYLALVFTFHAMIKEEEKYLQSVHGDTFSDYRRRVNRYFTILSLT